MWFLPTNCVAPPAPTWETEVRRLYERTLGMGAEEFEALLGVAMRGERPDHPDLPLFLDAWGMPLRRELR